MGIIRESFVIFSNWDSAIRKAPEDKQIELYHALMDYAKTGEISNNLSWEAKLFLTTLQENMEKSILRYNASVENGKLGGRPPKNNFDSESHLQTQENLNEPKTQENLKEPNKTQEYLDEPTPNLNVNVNVNVNDNIKEKKQKKKFGKFQNVCLCDDELNNLISEFGEKQSKSNIEDLSIYMETSGKTYKNHYAAVINFIHRNNQKKLDDKKALNNNTEMPSSKSYTAKEFDNMLDDLSNVEI